MSDTPGQLTQPQSPSATPPATATPPAPPPADAQPPVTPPATSPQAAPTPPAPPTPPQPTEPAFDVAEVTMDNLQTIVGKDNEIDPTFGPKFLELLNGATSKAGLAEGLLKLQNEMLEGAATEQAAAWDAYIKEMTDAVKADPKLGGVNEAQSLATARTVVERFGGTPEEITALKQLLNVSGTGNSIHMVRLLNNISAAIPGEATPVGGSPTPTTKSRADKLFGG